MPPGCEDREALLQFTRESIVAQLGRRVAAPASGVGALARPSGGVGALAFEGNLERFTAEVFSGSQRVSEGLTGPANLTLTPWLR